MMDDFTPTAAAPPDNPAGLLERLLDEAESQSSPPSGIPTPSSAAPTPPNAQSPTGTPPPSGMPPPQGAPSSGGNPLGSLFANPAVLAALPTLMENLSPLLGSLGGSGGGSSNAVHPHRVDRHTALLCAVKPYLSPARRDAAETVIRLCRVWDALERSGISLSGVLNTLGGAVPTNTEGRGSDV